MTGRRKSKGTKRNRAKSARPERSAANRPPPDGSGTGPRRKTLFDLPPLELECMKAVWAWHATGSGDEGVTVREIREQVAHTHRRLAYTTVETIMDRLTRKRMVEREKKGRAHRYRAVYRLEQARAEGVEILLNHFFGGHRRNLNAYLAGQRVSGSEPRKTPSPPPGARAEERPAARRRSPAPQPALDTELL